MLALDLHQELVLLAYGLAILGLLAGPAYALPQHWFGKHRSPPWFLGKVVYAPILGVAFLAVTHLLPHGAARSLVTWDLIWSVVQAKYSLLLLILSFAYLSISLDADGFFAWSAWRIAKLARGDGRRLLVYLFLLCSGLTYFTSNDIVIISMTPIILHIGAQAGIHNLVPLLVSQFIAANTASMGLYIGSPTNIVLGDATAMTFVDFFAWMFAPTLVATLTTLAMLLVLFHWAPLGGSRMQARYTPPDPAAGPVPSPEMWVKLAIFGVCLVLLTVSSFAGLSLTGICIATALTMFSYDLVLLRQRQGRVRDFLRFVNGRMPWPIAPFVIAFFVMVALLSETGVTRLVGEALVRAGDGSPLKLSLIFGYVSALAVNLLNDIPSTVFWADMVPVLQASLPPEHFRATLLSLIVGVNPGCYLSLIGALAGLMWINIIRTHPSSAGRIVPSGWDLFRYGAVVLIPVVLMACLTASLTAWLSIAAR